MKISQILDKIDERQLLVPAFQREYVWDRENAKELISSLIKDYPTGTMLTWETNKPPELKGDDKYNPKQGNVKIILDGQQRITTLYILMRGKIPPYYKEYEITNDITPLRVNIETLELQYYKKSTMDKEPLWVPIIDIFTDKIKTKHIFDKLENKMDEKEIFLEQFHRLDDNFHKIQKIPDREFKEQEVPTNSGIKTAIDIFYRVNAGGVNLTEAELALAQISGYWPQAREKFKAKLRKLNETGFVLKLDFIVYVLLGILHNMGSRMERLHDESNKNKIQEVWEKLDKEVLDYVFSIMKSHAYIDHTKEVNSVYAFVPIIVFVYNKGTKSIGDERIKKIVKWFYYSQIKHSYGSQFPTKLDHDLPIIVNKENPFDELIHSIASEKKLEISPDEFQGAGIQHPLWNLMNFYFKSKNAICLSTGIKLRKNMGKKYELERDHIFPFSLLKDKGYDHNNKIKYRYAQEIANRAVLTSKGIRTKYTQTASGYLSAIKAKFPNSLKLQCIPEDESLWELDNFELFLKKRRKMLAMELNQFIENIAVTTQEDIKMDHKEIIEAGENSEVELKTTLRYDINTAKVNKQIEEAVLKTIAAFSNVEGGTLIIGVTDDGEIAGLNYDYQTLKGGGDKDAFELHLTNLINEAYGAKFRASNISVSFPLVDEKEVCFVEIKRGAKPLSTKMSDKNGKKTKVFYIRTGNSSTALDIDEVADYIKDRFS